MSEGSRPTVGSGVETCRVWPVARVSRNDPHSRKIGFAIGDYRQDSGLYRAIRYALRMIDPSITDDTFLEDFQRSACYLIDVCARPVDHLDAGLRSDGREQSPGSGRARVCARRAGGRGRR